MSAADGGPAFPGFGEVFTTDANGQTGPQGLWGMHGDRGMSLRDYFAGQAPAAPEWWLNERIDARFPVRPGQMAWNGPTAAQKVEMMAEWAFVWADAMLAARSSESGRREGP